MCPIFPSRITNTMVVTGQQLISSFRLTARETLATAVSTDVSKTKHVILPLISQDRKLELMDFRSCSLAPPRHSRGGQDPRGSGTHSAVAAPALEFRSRRWKCFGVLAS